MKRSLSIIFLTLLCFTSAVAQQYVQTAKKCELYQLSDNLTYEMLKNNRYYLDVSDPSLVTKSVKKDVVLEVRAVANVTRGYKYDAYIVTHNWRYYLIKKEDVTTNIILEKANNRMDAVLDSLNTHIDYLKKQRAELDSISVVYSSEFDKTRKYFADSLQRAEDELKIISSADKTKDAGLLRYAASLPISELKRNSLMLINVELTPPTVSGSFDIYLQYKNLGRKTISYIMWEGRVRNIRNEIISCRLSGKTIIKAMDNGPVRPDENHGGRFSNLLTNKDAHSLELTSLVIYYMDGTTLTYTMSDLEQLMKIKDFYYRSYTSRREIELGDIIKELNKTIEKLDSEYKINREVFFIDDPRFYHLNDFAAKLRPTRAISSEIMKTIKVIEDFHKKNENYINLTTL